MEFETENIEKKYFLLYEKAKNESWLFNCLLKYVHFLNKRVETENLSGATFYNYFKNIKKFCLANDIEVKWHKLLSAPKKRRAAIDRPPTVPEIKTILEYPDRRIKFIVLTMCSSGMRIEGWNYLRWRNIKPVEKDGQIVAAKIVIYEGDAEEYYSFITAETYFSIKDWMDYRKEAGESINGNSWIVRDIWNLSVRGSRVCGFATHPNKLSIKAIKSLINRALWAQGLRTKLPEGKRRHEFQEAHGFRKFFETQCTMAGLKREIINKLMNHSNGVLDSYIKPSEDMLLNEYLKSIDYLTINENFRLQKEVNELKDKNVLLHNYENR
ncbi:MAG TPA: tyrosine-type recombinase/integrase [Nitrososphaeraceae archaeon]|nr:tyrosine-type recombinase/integrase [Nitrososphaeraceae archaeon]